VSAKKDVVAKHDLNYPQYLVFTGAGTGATRYSWMDGEMSLERGGSVLITEWPMDGHFMALLAKKDAYLKEADTE